MIVFFSEQYQTFCQQIGFYTISSTIWISKVSKRIYSRFFSLKTIIVFSWFRFDFCTKDESTGPSENLGQVVFGERIRLSSYKVSIDSWFIFTRALCFMTYHLYFPDSVSERRKMQIVVHKKIQSWREGRSGEIEFP